MGTNTLSTRSDGQIITQDWFNDFNLALSQDFVPRNASRVATASAGSIGTPSLPWLSGYFDNLVVGGEAIDPALLIARAQRITACKVTAEDFTDYLSHAGSSLAATLGAAVTNFSFVMGSLPYTLTADVVFAITGGFSSNNTMAINEASWTGSSSQEQQSLVFGEKAHESVFITFDAAGSNITGLGVGAKAIFRGANTSAAVEHILVEIRTISGSDVTARVLWRAIGAGENRIKFRNNDVWTLCKTTHLFIDDEGNNYETTVWPIEVDTLPSPSVAGRYIKRKSDQTWWFDDGSNPLTAIDRFYVGACSSHNATQTTAVHYFPEWQHFKQDYLDMKDSDVKISIANDPLSTSKGLLINGSVKLGYQTVEYKDSRIITSTAGDLESGTSDIGAVGVKYVYRCYSTGKLVCSDIMPRKWATGIFMHPYKMWRCIGYRFHSASAFYYGSQNGLIFHYPDLVLNASVSNTFANYTVFGGYCPSWIESLITNTDHGATTTAYTADYYTSTTDRIIATGVTYQFIAQLNPLFSGYARIRGSSAGVNWNHGGYISGMGLGHG